MKSLSFVLSLCLQSLTTCPLATLGSSLCCALLPHEGCFDFSQSPSARIGGRQPAVDYNSLPRVFKLSLVPYFHEYPTKMHSNLCEKIVCACVCLIIYIQCVYMYVYVRVWCVYIYTFKCTNRQTENNTQLYPDIPDLSPRCCLKTLTCNSSYLKKIQPKALKAGTAW